MITTALFLSLLYGQNLTNCSIQLYDPQEPDGRPCVEAIARTATDAVLSGEYPAWVERFDFVHPEEADALFNLFAEDATRIVGQTRDELFD